MRELKFRAWDKTQGVMVHFELGDMDGNLILEDEAPKMVRLDNCDIMQFIGEKDKNGTPIYEGDRVRWYTWDGYIGTETVVFRNGYFYPTIAKLEEVGTGNRFDESRGIEVIGNIYENPELVAEPS